MADKETVGKQLALHCESWRTAREEIMEKWNQTSESSGVLPNVKEILQKRLETLEELYVIVEKELLKAPEGCLRYNRTGKGIQYYRTHYPDRKNGEYISAANRKLAQELAQKRYHRKLIKAAESEIAVIRRCLNAYPDHLFEEVYSSLPAPVRDLAEPCEETEEDMVRRWCAVQYTGKDLYDSLPDLITDQNEAVRSKSELIIANILNHDGIPYRYEYPIALKGLGTVYPDFTILNIRLRKEVVWEHMGMMDDEDYAQSAIRKINAYLMNGFDPGENLILTFETRSCPLSVKIIQKMIQKYCR